MSKHSVVIEGHKTSVSMEDQFWLGLKEIAARRRISLQALVEQIARTETRREMHGSKVVYSPGLSGVLRLYAYQDERKRRLVLDGLTPIPEAAVAA